MVRFTHHDRAFSWLTMTRRAATVLPWHGGISEMVRFTHHDRAFSWLTMMQLAAAKSHVILTGGRDLAAMAWWNR
jgi:hypothetical protein